MHGRDAFFIFAKLRAPEVQLLLVGDSLQLFLLWGSFKTVYIVLSSWRIYTESAYKTSPKKPSHYVQFQTKENVVM